MGKLLMWLVGVPATVAALFIALGEHPREPAAREQTTAEAQLSTGASATSASLRKGMQ